MRPCTDPCSYLRRLAGFRYPVCLAVSDASPHVERAPYENDL